MKEGFVIASKAIGAFGLVTCRDEKDQVALLERFHGEGLECKALVA